MALPACMITQCHNPADYRLDKEDVMHISGCCNNYYLIFIKYFGNEWFRCFFCITQCLGSDQTSGALLVIPVCRVCLSFWSGMSCCILWMGGVPNAETGTSHVGSCGNIVHKHVHNGHFKSLLPRTSEWHQFSYVGTAWCGFDVNHCTILQKFCIFLVNICMQWIFLMIHKQCFFIDPGRWTLALKIQILAHSSCIIFCNTKAI